VTAALKKLGEAIDRGENLMPPIIDAVKCYASIGEVCAVMRERWGEYRDTSIR
jgi:methylmalonyl-CoA mutase N-terminal domain/subunit